jgi:hypothetical protein
MNPSIGKVKVRDSKVVSHHLDTRLVDSHEYPNIEQRYIRVLKDLFNKAADEMFNDKTGDPAPSLKVFIEHFSDFISSLYTILPFWSMLLEFHTLVYQKQSGG